MGSAALGTARKVVASAAHTTKEVVTDASHSAKQAAAEVKAVADEKGGVHAAAMVTGKAIGAGIVAAEHARVAAAPVSSVLSPDKIALAATKASVRAVYSHSLARVLVVLRRSPAGHTGRGIQPPFGGESE